PQPPDTYPLSLHDALPISDVARPIVPLQRLHGAVGHALDRALHGPLPLVDDEPHELRNVAAPLAQGRNANREDAQPVVQIVAELDRKSTRLNSSHDQISYA